MNRAGYVLVGGRSSRMGRDKAWLPVGHGQPLGGHIARLVAEAAGSATLVGGTHWHESLGFAVVPDRYPGEGPLGGILTALHHTSAKWNLVTACDMPSLTPDLLRDLLDAAEKTNSHIVIPEAAGKLEPLCAVYRQDALKGLEEAFARGIRKVTAAFDGLGVTAWPVAEVARFQNLNTPEDWERYAAG